MYKYFIDVIGGTDYIITADTLEWSEAGLYVFINVNEETGERTPVCYYPISRTIITKIEKIK